MKGAVWNAKANNPHYRITELVLPGSTSTGLRQFPFRTTYLPHNNGQIVVKSQDQEQRADIVAGRLIEFESGAESEVVNAGSEELEFTVMEFK